MPRRNQTDANPHRRRALLRQLRDLRSAGTSRDLDAEQLNLILIWCPFCGSKVRLGGATAHLKGKHPNVTPDEYEKRLIALAQEGKLKHKIVAWVSEGKYTSGTEALRTSNERRLLSLVLAGAFELGKRK